MSNRPGNTKVLEDVQIQNNPMIYCIDTPGITPLKRQNVDPSRNMNLALVGTFPEGKKIVDDAYLWNYLLHTLNMRKNFLYVYIFKLPGPTNSVRELATAIAT